MTTADAASVYEAGWSDDALYTTVLVTALFNFYNRLADGVGLALPEGYPGEAGKRLSTLGYDVFAQGAKLEGEEQGAPTNATFAAAVCNGSLTLTCAAHQ